MCKKYYFPIVSQWTMPPKNFLSIGQYALTVNAVSEFLENDQIAFRVGYLPLSTHTPLYVVV